MMQWFRRFLTPLPPKVLIDVFQPQGDCPDTVPPPPVARSGVQVGGRK